MATPGSVHAIHGAIALIQRIRYFKGDVASGSKLHVTIGHNTVLATVTFFGHCEIYNQRHRPQAKKSTDITSNTAASGGGAAAAAGSGSSEVISSTNLKEKTKKKEGIATTSLLAEDSWELPKLEFEWGQDFYWQNEMARGKGRSKKNNENNDGDVEDTYSESGDGAATDGGADATDGGARDGGPSMGGVQWCYLSFEQPVFTTMNSLLIASRLETENAKTCRIAFYGRILEKVISLLIFLPSIVSPLSISFTRVRLLFYYSYGLIGLA